MPDIRNYSTGRLGNNAPLHENTDHVNTRGLDQDGKVGIEGYIDEDIVRAYDDNRPIFNLLSNDELISYSIDKTADSIDFGAVLKNTKEDWALRVGDRFYYTNPENFLEQVETTPIRINSGVAYSSEGYITHRTKKLVGLKRSDGTTLWIEEATWYDDKTPTFDEPLDYSGYYRPIYVEEAESKLPESFEEYELTVKQVYSTGAIYRFPIYIDYDFVVPYASSVFSISGETTSFSEDTDYPGYDYFPNTFTQLQSNGFGILEIDRDSEVVKNLRKLEYKLTASDFNAEEGAFKAELLDDAFRNNKTANLNRIENDVNFIRAIRGVKEHNETSRVYFREHLDDLDALIPLNVNRDFLGSQEYSFDIAIENQFNNEYRTITIQAPQARGYQEFGLSVSNPSDSRGHSGTYNTKITINDDPTHPVTVSADLDSGDNLYEIAEKLQAAFDDFSPQVYAEVRVVESGSEYDIRVYSGSAGDYSTILMETTGSSDLVTTLGGSFETPVDASTFTETRWNFGQWPIYQDPTDNGHHRCVRSGGSTTTTEFESETIGRQIFEAMVSQGFDDFTVGIENELSSSHNSELYISDNSSSRGYIDLGMSVPVASADSGLEPLSTYYFQLSIDGGSFEEYSFTTSTDVSYSGVIISINSALRGIVKFDFTSANDIRITSDSYGPDSIVLTDDGVTGTNLFGFAYPGAGFTPVANHLDPVYGTGYRVRVKARRINTFALFTDSVKERAVYSHNDSKLYVTPDTETDIRDHVETEHAYLTRTYNNRWSTTNDVVFTIDLSERSDWSSGSIVTKIYSATFDGNNYLIVGNSDGQICFYEDGEIYDWDFDPEDFTLFTDSVLGTDDEEVNNFFVFEDSANSRKYLFVLTETHLYYADATSGLNASLGFTSVDTSSSLDVPNVNDPIFSKIYSAVNWSANVDDSTTNNYLIFIGKSDEDSSWLYAPILYALYDASSMTFSWYAEEHYYKTQVDDISSISLYDGWGDPEQDYQLFIANNANGPEIWTGTTQNNDTDIGGAGDDRFTRFSWSQSSLNDSRSWIDPLNVDETVNRINGLEIYDDKVFVASDRDSKETLGGFYSYGMEKLQPYFKRSCSEIHRHESQDAIYMHLYDDVLANSDPAIAKMFEETDDGRAQLISSSNLTTVSNWPEDSAFRLVLEGFDVGGITYDGEYDVVFDGSYSNAADIVDSINGILTTPDLASGLSEAFDVDNPPNQLDLTPVIRARAVTSLEKSGNTYSERYKIIIESKTADPMENSGHAGSTETTQSNCKITIKHPTQGATVVGTGSNTLEIDPDTTAVANLQLVDWSNAELYKLKRVSTPGVSFNGNSYVDITSYIDSGYDVLLGSLRVKSNSNSELGFNQGRGQIIEDSTPTGLADDSTVYTFKVTFDENLGGGSEEITEITCPADSSGSLSGTYWTIGSPYTTSPYSGYYVWYNVDRTSDDPDPGGGLVGVEVKIREDYSADEVAEKTAEALEELADFTTIVASDVITVTNALPGDVTDAADVDAGVTVNVTQQGADPSYVVDWVTVTGSAAQTIQDLIDEINADLTGGTASLEPLGGTSEYVDIVITSSLVGSDSSVKIEESVSDTYLFDKSALDIIPNTPIQGNTGLNTAGSQTFGYTWENTDYFFVPEHPTTGDARIYIPNGTTRIDTGDTVWINFWEKTLLNKQPADSFSSDYSDLDSDEWTFDINQKKIVVGEEPDTSPTDDILFVDFRVRKVLPQVNIGDAPIQTQEELSDAFHGTGPRNLENSDLLLINQLARISSLHYGNLLLGTDDEEQAGANYSFFLPRADVVAAVREANEYGARVQLLKGLPDANSPYVELPLYNQGKYAFLYGTLVSSQNYTENNIVEMPWLLSDTIERNQITLDSETHWFIHDRDLVSTKGLRPKHGAYDYQKSVVDDTYALVRTEDPLGIREPLKRKTRYWQIDDSNAIYVSESFGNNSNSGHDPDSPKLTLQAAISAATSTRPYIKVLSTPQKEKTAYGSVTINRGFKVYILAEHQIEIPSITANSSIYIEGVEVTDELVLDTQNDVEAKYCNIQSIRTKTSGTFENGIKLKVENSILQNGLEIAGSGSLDITGQIDVEFDHVYLQSSSRFLLFEPDDYDDSADNKFIFRHVTSPQTENGYIVDTSKQDGLQIEFIESLLASDTETRFNSQAPVTLLRTVSYVFMNDRAGAILSTESQTVDPGDIDVVPELGAPATRARDYDTDNLAINYVDRKYDAGAYIESRFKFKETEAAGTIRGRSTFISSDDERFVYNTSINPEQFTFFIRFKPIDGYQEAGVLFDSRYYGDFDEQNGAFNNNGNDFFQIVYDNETYGANYLSSDKYSFKLIISNGETTYASVIGPYYTTDDNAEYGIWHELAVAFEYKEITNARYNAASLTTSDTDRKQFVVYTLFDRQLSRVYLPPNKPFEDANASVISNSNWREGEILTDWFTVGGGWTSRWDVTQAGGSWGTWVTSTYSFLLDDFLVSNRALPLNAIQLLEEKRVIDPYNTEYYTIRHADKDSSLVLHCNNPHPYSDNGIEPFESSYVSYRQYEGWHQHAIAIERESENLITSGKIERGNWFDRQEEPVELTSDSTTVWGAAAGLNGGEMAILVQEDIDLNLKTIDDQDSITTTTVIAGDTIQLAKIKRCRTTDSYIIIYVDSTFNLNVVTVDSSLSVGTPYEISSNTISDFDFCGGHQDNRIAITYTDDTDSVGYIVIVDVDSNSTVYPATDFSGGSEVLYSTILESADKNGDNSYFIVYVEDSSNDIKEVMLSEDLSQTVVDRSTLVAGETPVDLQSITDANNNFLIKWKDATGSAPYDIKAMIVEVAGSLVIPPKTITADGSAITYSSYVLKQQESSFLFGYVKESDGNIAFKLYDQRLNEHENSQHLRNFDTHPANGRLYISTSSSTDPYNEADLYSDLFTTTTIDSDGTDIGIAIRMETEIPNRWYKDINGIYDEFEIDILDTKSFFGKALLTRLNHAASPGEGSISGVVFVSDAENGDFSDWSSRVQTDGSISIDTTNPAHRSNAYKFEYDGGGSELYLSRTGFSSGSELYGRFYIYLDSFFQLTSGGTDLEIAKFGPESDPVILELVYNDPLLGGDGKYQLKATQSIAGTDTTSSSVINYLAYQYIDIRYLNDASGGFQVWVDGSMVIDQTGFDVTASGDPDSITVGSTAGQAPEAGSGIYIDDVRVDTSFIGEYTIGLGQSDVWQTVSISADGDMHYLSGYYLQLSGNWLLRLEGPALDEDIEIEFGVKGVTAHRSSGLDSVEDIQTKYINWDRVIRFEIGFIPDNAGDINIHLMSLNSDEDERVDEWILDNIKLEHNDFSTSIDANQMGSAEYPVTLDSRGSAFIRLRPEFNFDCSVDKTIFSSQTEAEDQSTYLTHHLYYDAASNSFKFEIQDHDGNVLTVESDSYGDAQSVKERTDLNEEHTIVANWNADAGIAELVIDSRAYRTIDTPSTNFKRGVTTVIGNIYDRSQPVDCLFDLIRITDEMLNWEEIQKFSGKLDPFYLQSETNVGKAVVSALSFFGVQPPDEYTIYSERNNRQFGFDLVFNIGDDYNNRFAVKHRDRIAFWVDGLGLHVDGPIHSEQIVTLTTTSLATQDDHITLRYGFGGTPLESNDIYIESERGNLTNAEIRYDESQDAWVFHDGNDNEIAITGTQIGTWNVNDHFNLVASGTGHIKLFTETNTDGGAGSGTQNRTAGNERVRLTPSEFHVNPLQNTTDFRVSADIQTHMLWVDSDDEKVVIGRSSYPATAGSLVVNDAAASVYADNASYGFYEFFRNDGTRGGYVGLGDANAATPWLDLFADAADNWRITGHIRMQSGYDMYWADDTANARLEYTDDAESYADTAADGNSDLHGLGVRGAFSAHRVYNAVYNDYAESFEFDPSIDRMDLEPGRVYKMTEDGVRKTEQRAEKSVIGVYSDTYGHLIGAKSTYKVDSGQGSKIPIGIAGRVRVWVHETLEIGDLLVADADGFATKATDEERKDVGIVFGKVLESSADKQPKRIWIYIL